MFSDETRCRIVKSFKSKQYKITYKIIIREMC